MKLVFSLWNRCEAGVHAAHFPPPQGPSVPHTNAGCELGLPNRETTIPHLDRRPPSSPLDTASSRTTNNCDQNTLCGSDRLHTYNLTLITTRPVGPYAHHDTLRGHDSSTTSHSSKRKEGPSGANASSSRSLLPPEREQPKEEPTLVKSPFDPPHTTPSSHLDRVEHSTTSVSTKAPVIDTGHIPF
ncbi:hypothetical protein B0H19DRAFT_1264192 [Mycena capillaripes]|nr:hypothetical protein B0H19DRAFT_1264192 [Mycena capillaripes]